MSELSSLPSEIKKLICSFVTNGKTLNNLAQAYPEWQADGYLSKALCGCHLNPPTYSNMSCGSKTHKCICTIPDLAEHCHAVTHPCICGYEWYIQWPFGCKGTDHQCICAKAPKFSHTCKAPKEQHPCICAMDPSDSLKCQCLEHICICDIIEPQHYARCRKCSH